MGYERDQRQRQGSPHEEEAPQLESAQHQIELKGDRTREMEEGFFWLQSANSNSSLAMERADRELTFLSALFFYFFFFSFKI